MISTILIISYYFNKGSCLSCYDSESMSVTDDDIMDCGGDYDACTFRTKFGQSYWRRGCSYLSSCGDGDEAEGCESFIEQDTDSGDSYNVTSCCCTEDNCNRYRSIAARAMMDTDPETTDAMGMDFTSTEAEDNSGSISCYDSQSRDVTDDDIMECGGDYDVCTFRTKFGQSYWRRGCSYLSACGDGEGCVSFIEQDTSSGDSYNVTSCCCTEDNCNRYRSIAERSDGMVDDDSGAFSCYEADSDQMYVTDDDIAVCGGDYDACHFRTKFGQNYWSRSCTYLSACGESGASCISFMEEDTSSGVEYNVTSCCCTDDNCNSYRRLACKSGGESDCDLDDMDFSTTDDDDENDPVDNTSGNNYIGLSLSLCLIISFISINLN